jgi:hypothetical protein
MTHAPALEQAIKVAFTSVLKFSLKPTSAAELSAVTARVFCETANTVKT